jgi:hypothetical protein
MIKNFEDFLNENDRYSRTRTYNEASFADEAIKALTKAGFAVNNISTPRQKNNDNLACEISFPKILDFLKEYYNIEKERVICKSDVESFVSLIKMSTIVYKKGYAQRPGVSSKDFSFDSIPDLVNKMKTYFTAQFISGPGVFNAIHSNYNRYQVFPNDIRLDTKYLYRNRWLPGIGHNIDAPPLRKKLPEGAKTALNNIFPEFSSLYDKIYAISPEYLEYATDSYCAFIEFYYVEISDEKLDIHADLSNAIFDYSRDRIVFMDNALHVRKEKTHMKVSYYGEQRFSTSSGSKDFAPYLDKFRAMPQEYLEKYMDDYLHRKRGMLTGKKFGI